MKTHVDHGSGSDDKLSVTPKHSIDTFIDPLRDTGFGAVCSICL